MARFPGERSLSLGTPEDEMTGEYFGHVAAGRGGSSKGAYQRLGPSNDMNGQRLVFSGPTSPMAYGEDLSV